MTAIAEALIKQRYDVHHRGRETPTPTGNSSSPNRWRRRDRSRAYHLGGNNYSFDALQAYCFGINIKL